MSLSLRVLYTYCLKILYSLKIVYNPIRTKLTMSHLTCLLISVCLFNLSVYNFKYSTMSNPYTCEFVSSLIDTDDAYMRKLLICAWSNCGSFCFIGTGFP